MKVVKNKSILLSDYVIDFLVKKGVKDVFLVSGGGIMYLLDSIGRNKNIRYFTNHHEQASSIAAESYARLKNCPGVCFVTAGPGATNAITGVAGAWVDSIPMIIISGQVKRDLISDYRILRQKGPQEINIIPMVKPITKYAVTVIYPYKIRYELEKCFYEVTHGRPGPVWLDVPLDVQGSLIFEKKLKGFKPQKTNKDDLTIKEKIMKVIVMLSNSKRPVLILGNGIRLSHGEKILKKLIDKLKIPVLLPINAMDLIPENHPYMMGKFGPFGQRRGNFTLQNSDLILSIGASLNVTSIGFNLQGFAPKAKKIMINIDKGELTKNIIKIDLGIETDAKKFIMDFLNLSENIKFKFSETWIKTCRFWKEKYQNITPDYLIDKKHVNSYVFFDKLSDLIKAKDVITTGIALDICSLYQVYKVKDNQRVYVNKNFGAMGWSLPAAVGANIANSQQRTICVTGDGSFIVNIHELGTIRYYNLPIKIFIFNNQGYESIRYTQNNLFEGRLVGSDEKTGVSNPDFRFLAKTYKLPYEIINNNQEITTKIKKVLKTKGPVLCEVNISYNQRRMPRVVSYKRQDGVLESKSLEDMWPFLPKAEMKKNMSFFK